MHPSRRLGRILLNLVLIGGLGVPAAVAAAALSGMGHRWIDILAQFAAPALAVTIALALVALALRLRAALRTAVAVLLLGLIAVWPQWSPGGPRPDPASPTVTLYFANLYTRNDDITAIRRSIAAADADIVVLVEMSAAVTARADEILAGYPHRAVEGGRAFARGRDHIVIASRRPLTPHKVTGSELAAAAAAIQTARGPIDVFGLHLTRPWPYQYQWGQIIQTLQLTDNVKRVQNPVVLAGDFNSISNARIGRQVKADMGLVPAPGWPGTWPSRMPSAVAITIDQVYHDRRLAVVDRRLGLNTGSDHRPVIVRLSRARASRRP